MKKTILFFETQIEGTNYTVNTEEIPEINFYRTTIEQKDHKGNIIARICATYTDNKQKALDIAQNEIKNILC